MNQGFSGGTTSANSEKGFKFSSLSRAQEALQRTHLEMFASSDLVLLAVMEVICMQNIAGVWVTKV